MLASSRFVVIFQLSLLIAVMLLRAAPILVTVLESGKWLLSIADILGVNTRTNPGIPIAVSCVFTIASSRELLELELVLIEELDDD